MKRFFLFLSAVFLLMSSVNFSFAKDNVVSLPASTARFVEETGRTQRGEPKISNLQLALVADNVSTQLFADLEYSDVAVDITEARLTLVVLVYLEPRKEQFYPILLAKPVKELIDEGYLSVEKESESSGKLRFTIFIYNDDKINEKNYITGAGMTIADLPGRISFPEFVVF